MAKRDIRVMNFSHKASPIAWESTEKNYDRYVRWGFDNLYPNYLLKLYAESPTHAAILNAKASMITKGGLKYENGSDINIQVNPNDTFTEFVDKVVKSYLLFNAFCVEVIYNKLNQPVEYQFVDLHKVRTNRDKSKFWHSVDWQLGDKEIVFGRWVPNSKDTLSKFFYFDGYIPTTAKVYPVPEYNHILKTLQTDIAIRDFNLNNITNHFSVSTLITFFRGSNVADEIKNQIINDLHASYTGADGKKMIIDFQDNGGQSADIKNISPGEWDKAYELISKKVTDDILIGHQVTSPMLFGVKTEGQLGGSTELEVAYEIFKDNYIRNKRNELTSALNYMFTSSAVVEGKVKFQDAPLFATKLSEDTKAKIYTINELRKEQGWPPITNGDRFIGDPLPTIQPVKQSAFNSNTFHLSEEDFEKIKSMGISLEDFDFIEEGDFITSKEDFNKVELKFETEQEIADYIIKNQITDTSINAIKTDLRRILGIIVSNNELKDILQNLTKSGVLKAVIEGDNIKISKPAIPSRTVQVMYHYEVRTGLGAPIIETTRPFCRKLIENNRLYTREEVQTMSSIFGYDIFQYGGGWYRNPNTGELTSHCRHTFRSRTVAKRND